MVTLTNRSIAPEAAHAAVAAAVAVVDAGGRLIAFLRAAGAPNPCDSIAEDKAYTAASFKIPSVDLYNAVKDNAAVRDGLMQRDRLALFGGGLPIEIAGEIVGGIGVSGGSEEQDIICAKAGLNAIELLLKAAS